MKSEEQQLGRGEILHYYQINTLLDTALYVRGYNIYHIRKTDSGGNLLQAFADFIYPMHKHWDLYSRWDYVTKNSQQLGAKGHGISLGLRYNF